MHAAKYNQKIKWKRNFQIMNYQVMREPNTKIRFDPF